jgi:hypothetical protein
MNKFWNWMKEHKHGELISQDAFSLCCSLYSFDINDVDAETKNYLIGFMIQYVKRLIGTDKNKEEGMDAIIEANLLKCILADDVFTALKDLITRL